MEQAVSKKYAKALFQAAEKENAVEAVSSDLQAIQESIYDQKKFRHLLFNPDLAREKRDALFEQVLAGKAHPLTMQFLKLINRKRRENLFPEIHRGFTRIRNEAQNLLYAHITTAEPMDPRQREQLLEMLESDTGKRIEPQFHIDPRSLAGVKVIYSNTQLDGTLEGAIGRLGDHLRYEVLKQN